MPNRISKRSHRKSGSYDSLVGSAHREPISPQRRSGSRKHGDGRPSGSLSRHDTTGSSLISSYHHDRRAIPRGPPHHHDSLDSMPNGRLPNSLLSHRSIGAIRSQHAAQASRPRSPFAYPARLRRPGYRPASPALSDMHGSIYRSGAGYNRTPSIRTLSPSSVYARRRMPPGYYSELNQSAISLPRSLSPAVPSAQSGRMRSPGPSRVPTPNALRLHTNTPSTYHDQNASSGPGLTKSASSTTSVNYYDYTEAFHEEEDFYSRHNASMASLPFSIDKTIREVESPHSDDYGQIPGNITLGSAVRPAELPTSTSHKKSLESSPTEGDKLEALTRTRSVDPSLLQSGTAENAQHAESDILGPGLEQQDLASDLDRHPLPTSSISASSSSFHPSFVDSSRGQHDLRHLSSRIGSSISSNIPADSTDHMDPMLGSEKGRLKPTNLGLGFANAPPHWKLPSMNFTPLRLSTYSESSDDRPRSSGDVAETDHAGILAPVAERPVSSQSHHNRFSKILSIDDYTPDMTEIVTTFDAADRPFTPDHFLQATNIAADLPDSRRSSRFFVPPVPKRSSTLDSAAMSSSALNLMHLHEGERAELANNEAEVDDEHRHSGSLKQSILSESADDMIKQARAPLDRSQSSLTLGWPAATVSKTVNLEPQPESVLSEIVNRYLAASPVSEMEDKPDPPLSLRNLRSVDDFPPPPQETLFAAASPQLADDPVEPGHPAASVVIGSESSFKSAEAFVSSLNLTQDDDEGPEISSSPRQKFKLKMKSDRESSGSSPGSRPWNMDDSYTWSDELPAIDLCLPNSAAPSQGSSKKKKRRFKLKMKMPGAAQGKTARVGNPPPSEAPKTPDIIPSPFAPERILAENEKSLLGNQNTMGSQHGTISSQRTAGNVFGPSDPVNNSRIGSRHLRRPADIHISSSNKNLSVRLTSGRLPVTEAQSFFSDDSSHIRHRGSIRKRLSDLRSRLPAQKSPSMDNATPRSRATSRSTAGRPRTSERTAEHVDDGTVGMSNFEYSKRRVIERLKDWWRRHSFQRRLRLHKKSIRGRRSNAELYPGV